MEAGLVNTVQCCNNSHVITTQQFSAFIVKAGKKSRWQGISYFLGSVYFLGLGRS